MKVILLENIRKVGSIGEIIDVKRGFARNFLIAHKKALFASKENIKEVEKIKNELNKKDLDKKNHAKTLDEKLKDTENVDINPSIIQPSKEIKSLGIYNVVLNLHSEIQSQIKIKVIAQEENK